MGTQILQRIFLMSIPLVSLGFCKQGLIRSEYDVKTYENNHYIGC